VSEGEDEPVENLLLALFGVLFGAFIVIRVEEYRKPRLMLRLVPAASAQYPSGRPARRGYFNHLEAI